MNRPALQLIAALTGLAGVELVWRGTAFLQCFSTPPSQPENDFMDCRDLSAEFGVYPIVLGSALIVIAVVLLIRSLRTHT